MKLTSNIERPITQAVRMNIEEVRKEENANHDGDFVFTWFIFLGASSVVRCRGSFFLACLGVGGCTF